MDVTGKYHPVPRLVLPVKDQGPVAALWLCCLGLLSGLTGFLGEHYSEHPKGQPDCADSELSTSFIPWLTAPGVRLSLIIGNQRGKKKSISVLSQSSSGRGTFPASWRLR